MKPDPFDKLLAEFLIADRLFHTTDKNSPEWEKIERIYTNLDLAIEAGINAAIKGIKLPDD
jgi:hypothetical protein